MKVKGLKDIVKVNNDFRNSINIYLNLNKRDKIAAYIPTSSSVAILKDYLDAIENNKEQASILVGPYGKGKSHLLLVLLAILSMDRQNKENQRIVDDMICKIDSMGAEGHAAVELIQSTWENKRYLPILINGGAKDLDQAFLFAINDALKREGLSELAPKTFFSVAIDRIDEWKNNYQSTYTNFVNLLQEEGKTISQLRDGLHMYAQKDLEIFKRLYPQVTSGSEFNPFAAVDILSLYKSVTHELCDKYGFRGVYIVFDEFGKFIEGQDDKNVSGNMKTLQDLCELATDSKNSQLYITMVAHKSIKEYGRKISPEVINAFTGIEGRIVEKYFVTSSKNNYELIHNAIIKDEQKLTQIPCYEKILGKDALTSFYQVPYFRSNFKIEDFERIVLKGCFPLNPVAAYLLLNISEKVAQNERTLFTFISNDEPNSMAQAIKESNAIWSISPSLIYDYFIGLFKREVTNEYVHNQWLNAEYALSKCETIEESQIIKTLALLLIVNKEEEMPANIKGLSLAANSDDAVGVIESLEDRGIIYRKGSTNCYVFKTRAGSVLKSEIKNRRALIGNSAHFSKSLEAITGKHYIIPRRYNSEHDMTRYFAHEYMDSDTFIHINSSEALMNSTDDGKVISLFGFKTISIKEIEKHLELLNDRRLVVVCPSKTIRVKNQLIDYEIIQELKNDSLFIDNNEILRKELPILEEDLETQIDESLRSIYIDDEKCRVLYFDGNDIQNRSASFVEEIVNDCCEEIYARTPRINNEIINRKRLTSAQTKKARLAIIDAILSHTDDEKFYSGSNQPASIYRSLFCVTGIVDGNPERNIAEILMAMNQFIDTCADNRRFIRVIAEQLTGAPYGVRSAVLPLYFAYALARRNEDVIIYFANVEQQLTAEMIVNMFSDDGWDSYEIFVSREDVEKERYLNGLNVLFEVNENRNLTNNRIRNIVVCMQRWFRALPQVTRNFTKSTNYDRVTSEDKEVMFKIKRLLQRVEINPYEIVFKELPEITGNRIDLSDTYEQISKAKTAYEDYYDWLIRCGIDSTYRMFTENRRSDLYHLLKEWYERQSTIAKNGLHGGRVTNLMTCIETLDEYNDSDIVKRVIKAVTDTYIENWGEDSLERYVVEFEDLKALIESIGDERANDTMELSFTGHNGMAIHKNYRHAESGTGSILKNIIEDALDEYDDLSVNDRVDILLEMIERILS